MQGLLKKKQDKKHRLSAEIGTAYGTQYQNLPNFDIKLVIFYSHIFSCVKLWYFDIRKFNYQKHSGRRSTMIEEIVVKNVTVYENKEKISIHIGEDGM